MTMRNLEKRIVLLEKLASAKQHRFEEVIKTALGHLTPGDLELLLSAAGAEAHGKPLSEPETVARRTYEGSFKAECRKAHIPQPTKFDHTAYLDQLVPSLLAFRFTTTVLQLAIDAAEAIREGVTPSEAGSEAITAVATEQQRLYQLRNGERRGEEHD